MKTEAQDNHDTKQKTQQGKKQYLHWLLGMALRRVLTYFNHFRGCGIMLSL